MSDRTIWIKIEHALPALGMNVIIAWKADVEYGIGVGYLENTDKWYIEGGMDYQAQGVTHWAFLPEHPLK